MKRAVYISRFFSAASIGAVLLLAAGLLVGCGGGNTESTAEVNEDGYALGTPITDSTYALIVESSHGSDTLSTAFFQEQIQGYLQGMPPSAVTPQQMESLHRGIAEEFIRRHLIGGEAQKLGLEADTAAVSEQLNLIQSNVGGPEALAQALASRGMTMDSLRASIAEGLRLQQMQERMLEDAGEPTDAEIEAFRQEQAEQVRAQHILFMPEDGDKEGARKRAEAVLDSIKAGADFAEMARRYGTDGTAQRGGDLGYFSRRDMVPPFSEAAFALSDSGDVAPEPVETEFGYHLIRLAGRRTAEPIDSAQARAFLMQERQREAYDAAFDLLRENVTVRVNPNIVQADLSTGV